ncbi:MULTISPECIES: UDP-glucose 4-epimerase GalE [Cupriavidus]|uniref:UDP-glucose 4-epimerase n=1 Tax=Cupriavidus oxalaticus TaxID=96344 RepID=A0A4P7L5V5_9BURK|nr:MULTISPECIES: UDP-glucose 4-epimerase GalE [Cupriavidus]MBF6988429.1 UDP-glucose 4-epimerase GalE [Cupriavidus sp. IK-TO18]QBY50924.1 UDP-glucose 4-epimerase GalE [Cupriavidus oxalaticus]TDF61911.1 UDP-glucose 4-epimerase GalE [Cupriavidus sp. L7L]
MPETLLLTGATGYIASHTWVALLNAGYHVIGLDNLCNSSPVVIERLAAITGKTPHFVQGDVRDRALLDQLFAEHRISGVIHFAALKAVGESVSQPLQYYSNNLDGLLTVCAAMGAAGVKQLVFSSSATVYGNPQTVPILEDFPLSATNPYGQTKLMGEQILRDLEKSDPAWRIAYLRYFNPVGAHESGLIGEDPRGIPNNLMPYVAQVAGGRREKLMVFGGDYPTPDGTGVRDYIHVCDLADGHLAALVYLRDQGRGMTVNLGTGRGYSVLEVVEAYQRASGKPVPYEIVARRPGDIASCYADPALANQLLGWRAQHDIERMCQDSWRWQSMNPQGFGA